MEELVTKRINGYLDLDSYFIEKMGRQYNDLEDLSSNGLIDIEPSILQNKFWIIDPKTGYRIALFKSQQAFSDEAYAELLSEEVAKVLNIPVAHYDLATFNGKKGVLSYNFIKEYDDYYSGFDIILDFYDEKLIKDEELSKLYNIDNQNDGVEDVVNKLNNLEDVWSILEDRYKNHPRKEEIVPKIVDGLVDRLIFDILMINADRHADNWGELDSIGKGKDLSPAFDNARTLNMHNNVIIESFDDDVIIQDQELRFTVDNSNEKKPLEVLDKFLKISSSEYKDRVIEKVKVLEENVEFIPLRVEERTKKQMPDYLKSYFIHYMYDHLDKVNEVINNHNKGTKI